MKLKIRKLWGKLARLFSPGYSICYRCGRPWTVCTGHITSYSNSGGCFPLCTSCWSELSIKERLPYYRSLVDWWIELYEDDPDKHRHNGQSWSELWEELKFNVLAGY